MTTDVRLQHGSDDVRAASATTDRGNRNETNVRLTSLFANCSLTYDSKSTKTTC